MRACRSTFQFGANRPTAQGRRRSRIIVGMPDRDDSFGDPPKRDAKAGIGFCLNPALTYRSRGRSNRKKFDPEKLSAFPGHASKYKLRMRFCWRMVRSDQSALVSFFPNFRDVGSTLADSCSFRPLSSWLATRTVNPFVKDSGGLSIMEASAVMPDKTST
jgi:hypothetical protein